MKRIWSLPSAKDADVLKLNQLNGLSGAPVYVQYQNNGYQPAFCHISAKHMAMKKGGKRVHGWSYWRATDEVSGQLAHLLMAEHHSVWETEDGELIDVTPPRHGGQQTLFLRDDEAKIVSVNGEIRVRTNLADLARGVFLRDGEPVDYCSYALPKDSSKLAFEYAGKIGFDMARYPTEPQHG